MTAGNIFAEGALGGSVPFSAGMNNPLNLASSAGGAGGLLGSVASFAGGPTGMLVGAGLQIAGGLFGGNKAANAAHDAAVAAEKAAFAQQQYNLDLWDMKRSQLQANRMEQIDSIMVQARNNGKVRAYNDAAAVRQYELELQIRDEQQRGNENAFKRSEDIYYKSLDLNSLAAKSAMDSNIVALEEAKDEIGYDRIDSYIEMLQNEGKLRARGVQGRSASKAVQSTMADYGRQMEMLNATEDSMGRNTRAVLEEIIQDKTSADLTAYANKMLDPGVLPMPLKPVASPVPEIHLPRALQAYDFGPLPIQGHTPSPNAASNQVWGQTIANVAGVAGKGLFDYAQAIGAK